MTDDDKALVKRLGAQKNNQLNAIEALARIEAQAAEIERLRDLIGITGGHWLALQLDHPIKWEGSIDAAMEAACAEIERLRSALKRIAGGWPKPMQLARETLEK